MTSPLRRLRTGHAGDCDGYRSEHVGRVVQISRKYRGMWRAGCGTCPWTGTLVGPGARDLARREANGHTVDVECDGRCVA